MELRPAERPSLARGVRLALRLPEVVLALFVVGTAAILPLRLALEVTLGQALGALPPSGPLPVGELPLIALNALVEGTPFLSLAALWSLALLWLWTVLWHAAVATFEAHGTGQHPALSVLLGLGLVSFWRYLRLSLAAVAATVVAMVVLWGALGLVIRATYTAMAETWALAFAAAGVVVTLAWLPLAWSATLRGVWILARPERRSATLAWLRGLADSLRTPLRSSLPVLAWSLAALVATGLVEVLASWLRPLSGVVGLTLSLIGGLGRAFCWVALLGSSGPQSVPGTPPAAVRTPAELDAEANQGQPVPPMPDGATD